MGIGAALAIAVAGGWLAAALAAGRPADTGDGRAQLLVEMIDAPPEREIRRPRQLSPGWSALHDRMETLKQEAGTSRTALAELERFRRQAELACAAYGEGRDPLADVAELRQGPLRDLLEASKSAGATGPVVSRLPLGEEELVGVDGEPFPVPWPAGADGSGALDPRAFAELRGGMDELVRGLEELEASLPAAGAAGGGTGAAAASGTTLSRENCARTPAQLVDAVVHTAADGIEDLAAGLMRANELAAVAERVTNRATLLALNAALEATRSGSEAFASIAEETRRLAEFAREATDTISRLANEIEFKVGETIHAIHQSSESAKHSLAALDSREGTPAAAPPAAAAQPSRDSASSLLARARELRASLPAPSTVGAPAPPAAPAPSTSATPAPAPPAAAGALLTIDPCIREDLVQNGAAPADTREAKDFLLLEGLEPGARLPG
jgi:hypothetical protein